jgi:uncharacterized membrane protein HdeD (DUF308 family)
MSEEPFTSNPFAGAENDANVRAWASLAGWTSLTLGSAAILYDGTAPAASVFIFGWVLLLAGVIQAVHAYQARAWGGLFPYLFVAGLRLATGSSFVLYPTASSEALTLTMCLYLMFSGLFTTFGSIELRFPGWRWSVLSGLTSMALAFLLAIQWPTSGPWFIGLAIGIDLMAYGCAFLMFGRVEERTL